MAYIIRKNICDKYIWVLILHILKLYYVKRERYELKHVLKLLS